MTHAFNKDLLLYHAQNALVPPFRLCQKTCSPLDGTSWADFCLPVHHHAESWAGARRYYALPHLCLWRHSHGLPLPFCLSNTPQLTLLCQAFPKVRKTFQVSQTEQAFLALGYPTLGTNLCQGNCIVSALQLSPSWIVDSLKAEALTYSSLYLYQFTQYLADSKHSLKVLKKWRQTNSP